MIIKMNNKNENFYNIMGKHFASKSFIKELDCQLYDNNCEWYMFFDEKQLLGFASLENKNNYYYLDNFYVFQECRNKGIAKEILKEILKDYTNIKLISRNEYAIKIFKKYGFKEYGKNGRYLKMEYKEGA